MIEKIYEEDFEARVLKSEVPVVVDFFADWCGPCKMLAPIIEQLAENNDDVEFFKVNIDENPQLADDYDIMSIPNVVMFKDGDVADRVVGLRTAEQMQEFINENK